MFDNITTALQNLITTSKEIFPYADCFLNLLLKIYKIPTSLLKDNEVYTISNNIYVNGALNLLIEISIKLLAILLMLLPIIISLFFIKKIYLLCLKNTDINKTLLIILKVLFSFSSIFLLFINKYIKNGGIIKINISYKTLIILNIIFFIGLIIINFKIKNNIVLKLLFIVVDLLLGFYYTSFTVIITYLIYTAFIVFCAILLIAIVLPFFGGAIGIGGGSSLNSSEIEKNTDNNKDTVYDEDGNEYTLKDERIFSNDTYEDKDGNEYELKKGLFFGDEFIKK